MALKKFEKVLLDLIDIIDENKYILVVIDYFTINLWTTAIDNKQTKTIIGVLEI